MHFKVFVKIGEIDDYESTQESNYRWVLSLGGRILDFKDIDESIELVSQMLKIGFEFVHYKPEIKSTVINSISSRLTESELKILEAVCI